MYKRLPLIGIPCKKVLNENDFPPKFHGARQSYIDAIVLAGGIPILIPLTLEKEHLTIVFEKLDGFLVPGGEDVNPELYKEQPHTKLGMICKDRDKLESSLIKLAFEKDKPLLAICRGLQIMNVALGGSLFQDLASQCDVKYIHNHDSVVKDDSFWKALVHEIKIEQNCKLNQILKTETIMVNSLHHQAIKELSPLLKITANYPDKVIEAVEPKEQKRFFLGIQCHPEALVESKLWLNLFQSFIEAC